MQEELQKLRTESKQLKHRLKNETESRKNWQDIAKKKDDDMNAFKQQIVSLAKEVDHEKRAHSKTQQGLQLKLERLKIAESQNKKLQKDLDLTKNSSPPRRRKNQPSYEQPTFEVTEDELAKTGGKERIFAELKKRGEVAFPEGASQKAMSRIEQLRAGKAAAE